MTEHKIEINKTAIYQTFGNPKIAKKIIFALHGYGQLTKYFIRKFNALSSQYFIIAPEGFHRFYLKGSSGRIGASWMTKENREDDINNNVEYLNQLWNHYNSNYQFDEKIILGFSQGGATASRWQLLGGFKADKFILWASVFPSDLAQNWQYNFNTSKNYFIVGSQDQYFSTENIDTQMQYFTKNKVKFAQLTFNGEHEINLEILKLLCP